MQTAVVLLLLEMDRKAQEDREKKLKGDAERQRIDDLHAAHFKAAEELKRDQDDLHEVLNRLDERMMMMEEQVLDIRKGQSRRGWW